MYTQLFFYTVDTFQRKPCKKPCKKRHTIHRKIEDVFPNFKKPCKMKKELYSVLENRAKKVIMKTQLINSTKFIHTYIF